jgi:7-cyano-7-deazaguanine synthase
MSDQPKNKCAIVAVSGGMDSCVTAAVASLEYDPAFIHINYGQRTEARELKAFNDIADYYKVDNRMVIDMGYLARIGGSSLTDTGIEVSQADLLNKSIPSSYVPFRNANILSACVSWAEKLGSEAVFIGAVADDSSGYPDCRPEFFELFEKLAQTGTKPSTKIKIVTPIINYNKKDIVVKGVELNAPLHLTWSCYKDEEKACGRCDSCAFRLRGFQMAGVEDPIPYAEKPNYL